MGTKVNLAPAVAEVIQHGRRGVLLDVFSGMCSVGEAVGTQRQVWNNDVQVFAAEVARALFTSVDEPMNPLTAAEWLYEPYQRHHDRLAVAAASALALEEEMLSADSYERAGRVMGKLEKCLARDLRSLRGRPGTLFTTRYANTYFGVRQALEIDAIAHATRRLVHSTRLSGDQARWCLIVLGRAMLKVANSTGHFAQFLKPKEVTFRRFTRQRRRHVWAEWLFGFDEMHAVGTCDWRRNNRVFNEDATTLIKRLRRNKIRPSVVYADPPYTDDQYSRYYHLFETLALYDYPKISKVGLYRHDRFHTPFSVKSQVEGAFRRLIGATAGAGADFVLSYPDNGLLHDTGARLGRLLEEHFAKVEICFSQTYAHSTFGASKGPAKNKVTEVIYLARP